MSTRLLADARPDMLASPPKIPVWRRVRARRWEATSRVVLAVTAFVAPLAVSAGVAVALGDADASARSLRPAWGVLALTFAVMVLALGGRVEAFRRFTGVLGTISRMYVALGFACWVGTVVDARGANALDADHLVWVWLLTPPVLVVTQTLVLRALRHPTERVLIVGSGLAGSRLRDVVLRQPESRVELVGYVDAAEAPGLTGAQRLGGLEDLPLVVRRLAVDRVVVAFTAERDGELAGHLRELDGTGVRIDVVPRFFELVGPSVRTQPFGPIGLVSVPTPSISRATVVTKRALDLVVALVTLAVAAIPMAVIALLIRLDDGAPVLFRQDRVGYRGRPFRIVKFRTMRAGAEDLLTARLAELRAQGYSVDEANDLLKQQHDPRVTRVGRFLRASSLDELPQLLNVLRGEMSIVGPRPLPLYEADAVQGWQHRRHDVRPGITGLWQVLGRSETAWNERMALDYLYVRRLSVEEDLRILARTARTVVVRSGAR